MVSLLCSSRSGSTSLSLYLGIDRNDNLENLHINNNRERIINLKKTKI
jgi:hypothetical protein|tara:strand:+ start:78 stop:221 length:144 start_codon:yes stop_codon:yes gene_type:complete